MIMLKHIKFLPTALVFLTLAARLVTCISTPPASKNVETIETCNDSEVIIQPDYEELLALGPFWGASMHEQLQDWSVYNYSSEEFKARNSIVRAGDKIYDPLSFKGAPNDSYAIAFYLSTEVAVSAAQARNGTLFNVSKIDGNAAYRTLMAQIQQDLKGDRGSYYSEALWSWPRYFSGDHGFYFDRLSRYMSGENHYEPPTISPITIFRDMLLSLKNATEEALGTEMLPVESDYRQFQQGKIYVLTASPWRLNHTLSWALLIAAGEAGMDIGGGGLANANRQIPYIDWWDHADDERDYGGEEGTVFAFDQASKYVEMMEYDPYYRWGDFVCGTGFSEEMGREREEMIANGTWVEPPKKGQLDLPCMSFSECLWTFIKAEPGYQYDATYWKWYHGYIH